MTRDHQPEPFRVRAAIVEDHLLQRKRTEQLLGERLGMHIVCSVESMQDFLDWLSKTEKPERPHLLMLDLMVERQSSVDPAMVERLTAAGLTVVVLSALASPPLVRSILRAGVSAIVGKRDSEDDIIAAVTAAMRGEEWMTPDLASVIASDPTRPQLSDQEERAMTLYASGLTLDAVAASIGVKRDTAKKYLDRVKAKYADAGRPVRTKVDFSKAALHDGYLDLDGHLTP